MRTQDPTPSAVPCQVDPVIDPATNTVTTPGVPADCTPSHKTLFIPNVTTDVGLSPPYNSLFTFFGQFFDHGVDQTFKAAAPSSSRFRADDPLRTLGPDGNPNTPDQVPDSPAFMVLTRAKNQPGPDGILGTADDIQDAKNTDSPWVDQSQTYTSHPSHQAFLREYVVSPNGRDGKPGTDDDNGPVATGKLLGDPKRALGPDGVAGTADDLTDSGMAPWAAVKDQARRLLGIDLTDPDLLDIPMLATDPYGEFLPAANGLPQLVTKGADGKPNTADDKLVPGNLASPTPVPSDVIRLDTPFVGDIAHNADPSPQPQPDGTFLHAEAGYRQRRQRPGEAADAGRGPRGRTALLRRRAARHALRGRRRPREREHRAHDDPPGLPFGARPAHRRHQAHPPRPTRRPRASPISTPSGSRLTRRRPAANVPVDGNGWAGDRLFQAARFVTEMEYQHIVFEEFARKVQPAVRLFHVYNPDHNPAIPAEFAHAVYRFGHSMLDDDVARKTIDPQRDGARQLGAAPGRRSSTRRSSSTNARASTYTPEQAAGAVVMGSSDQVGNELDEFVVETLRNNLLGLPLDLPTINMARAREAGVLLADLRPAADPCQDQRRREMAPYMGWSDFGQHLKHPESLINYVAVYGTHWKSGTPHACWSGASGGARRH